MDWGRGSDDYIPFSAKQDVLETKSLIEQAQPTGGASRIHGLATPPTDTVELEMSRAKLFKSRGLNSRSATPAANSHIARLQAQQQVNGYTSAVTAPIRQASQAHNDPPYGNIKSTLGGKLAAQKTIAPERNPNGQNQNGHNRNDQIQHSHRSSENKRAEARATSNAQHGVRNGECSQPSTGSGIKKRKLDRFREREELGERLANIQRAEEEEDRRAAFVSGNTVFSSRPSTVSMQPPPLHPTRRPSSTAPSAPASTQGEKRPFASAESANQPPEKHRRVRHDDPRNQEHSLGLHGQSSLEWARPQSKAPFSQPNGDGAVNLRQGSEESTGDEVRRSHRETKDPTIDFKKRGPYPLPTHSFVSMPPLNRYFLIKSWNYENMTQSQSDGVWATQWHNTPVLREAFSQCASSRPPSHVVLIFSVNKSGAFQGYAIMTSPPGAALLPKWAQKLYWPCGEPFFVEWKAKGNVWFQGCDHIKNPLNRDRDDLSVVVGRDGQEIEPSAGRDLIDVIETVCNRY